MSGWRLKSGLFWERMFILAVAIGMAILRFIGIRRGGGPCTGVDVAFFCFYGAVSVAVIFQLILQKEPPRSV